MVSFCVLFLSCEQLSGFCLVFSRTGHRLLWLPVMALRHVIADLARIFSLASTSKPRRAVFFVCSWSTVVVFYRLKKRVNSRC